MPWRAVTSSDDAFTPPDALTDSSIPSARLARARSPLSSARNTLPR